MSDMSARDELVQQVAEALNVDHAPDGTITPLTRADRFFWEASLADAETAVQVVLAAGWRPPARTVGTVEELDALAKGTVVLDAHGRMFQKLLFGWEASGYVGHFDECARPATVLWEPEEESHG